MIEAPRRKSHTTAWIVSIVAVPVLYLFGYPWVLWGWVNFAGGDTPHWLETLGGPWNWMDQHPVLGPYTHPYWMWCWDACTDFRVWVGTLIYGEGP